MEPLYKLHTIMTKEDYINFNMYYMEESKNGKKTTSFSRWLLPLLLFIDFLLFRLRKEMWHIPLLMYAVVSLLWWFIVPHFNNWLLKKNIKAMEKDGKLPYMPEGIISFYDEHLIDKNDDIELKIKYSQLEKLAENKSSYYIFYSSTQAELIPFNAFKNENEREEFKCFIESKINKNVR